MPRHGTIPTRTINRFLNGVRDDCRHIKELSDKQLRKKRDELLPTRPPVWNALDRDQRACLLLGAERGRFMYFNDTGTGKTFLALALIRYFRKLGKADRVLVLVPNKSNKIEWQLQIAEHTPQSKCCILDGSSAKKWELLDTSDALIFVETYAGLSHMVSDATPEIRRAGKLRALTKAPKDEGERITGVLKPAGRRKKPKPVFLTRSGKEWLDEAGKRVAADDIEGWVPAKGKLKPSAKKVGKLVSMIGGLILDETTEVKNRTTIPYRVCRKLSQNVNFIFGMSGTPFGTDPTDLWSQMHLIDGGESLGATLGLFRAAFFREVETEWSVEYHFRTSMEKKLHRLLAHRSIAYQLDEADLPAVTDVKRYCELPDDARSYYNLAKKMLHDAKGSYQETQNAFLRMRQISSGFLGYTNDTTGDKLKVWLPRQVKLELLDHTLSTIDPRYKVVVYYEFTPSGDRIVELLKQSGIGHVRLYGKTKDHEGIRDKFRNNPACRVMVLQNRAGAFGLNLQFAKYGIFYEMPVSAIMWKQTRARLVRRRSSHDRVTMYQLMMLDTVDQQIDAALAAGKDLFDAIIRG